MKLGWTEITVDPTILVHDDVEVHTLSLPQ